MMGLSNFHRYLIIGAIALLCNVDGLLFAQSALMPSGVWSVGSLSPKRSENVLEPPVGLLLELKGGLPISFTQDMVTVRGASRGVIPGTFSNQGFGVYTHSFMPNEPFPASDTIFVTLSGNMTDVLGDFLDGNGNDIPEGAPDDDFTYWFIIGEINSTAAIAAPSEFSVSVKPLPAYQNVRVMIDTDRNEAYHVSVFNLSGKKLGTIYEGNLPPGIHTITWDASRFGQRVPAGTYFIAVRSAETVKVVRAIIM